MIPEMRLEPPEEDQPVQECPVCGEWIFPGYKIWTNGTECCCRHHMDPEMAEHLGWLQIIAEAP